MTDQAAPQESTSSTPYGLRQWLGCVIGPACLFATVVVAPPEGLSPEGWLTAGVALLMATFWITEVLPIPVTALLPLVLFPVLDLSSTKEAAAPYANPLIFLFLGGFIIALAMQRWNLHVRLAVTLISKLGTHPKRLIASFLLSAALISMWVSNTATALMMLPIGMSVIQLLPKEMRESSGMKSFAVALTLAVAYGATTGGMATLIGTPPNALLAAYMNDVFGIEIGFGQWMLIGLPVTIIALPIVYVVLTRIAFRFDGEPIPGLKALIQTRKSELGSFGRGERAVAIVFTLTALSWICQPLIEKVLPMVSDTVIAITGAIILFAIPINARKGIFVMDWQTAKGVPWEILILFGGGLSLARNIQAHGLSEYLGQMAGGLANFPTLLVLAILCFGILLLTEFTSNTATAATFLPIVAAVCISFGHNPFLFLIPTALAANCSYIMPVGTPPNAIVFGSGMVTLPQMVRAGFLLNILLVPIIVGVVWILSPLVFGVELNVVPDWAK